MRKKTEKQREFFAGGRYIRTYASVAFLVLVGTLFSFLFFTKGRQLEYQGMKARFTEAARARISLLEKEVEMHSEHVGSVAAFYDGSIKVERAEFAEFVRGPWLNHPDIIAFMWIPRVTARQRDEYEQQAGEEGLADFQIKEMDPNGRYVTASAREEYFPVYFLEPYEGNEFILGLDFASTPDLFKALDHAGRTGELTASGQLKLGPQANSDSVYMLAMPVYKKTSSTQTTEGSGKQISGYVVAIFKHKLTLGHAEKSLEPAAIDIYIYDNSAPKNERFVYHHPSRAGQAPVKDYLTGEAEAAKGFYLDRTISIGQRQWLIRCVVCPEYITSTYTWHPWASLFIGLLFTAFAAKYLLDKAHETKKLQKLVDAVTARLYETELIFEDFFKNAPIGFHVFGPDRLIIDINQAELDMIGYTREEIVDRKTWGDLIIPEQKEQFKRHWHEIISKGQVRNLEYTLIHKDGNNVDVLLNASARLDRSGNLINTMGSVVDITERKQDESERELLLKTLASKNEELESIVFISSHDLRSPLVNIQGFSGELGLSCKQLKSIVDNSELSAKDKKEISAILNGDIAMELEYIINSTSRMDMLIRGLLKLSRLGRAVMDIRCLDMNDTLASILGNLYYQINEKNIKVEVDDLPKCYGDESQIGQVFTNLLSNAIKYLEQSHEREIHISGQRQDDKCIYCVRDNGIGIDKAYQDVIFDVFHRLNPAETTEGEGLGLTIVKRIVDRHNGRIWVESEVDKFCCFYVELPAKAFISALPV